MGSTQSGNGDDRSTSGATAEHAVRADGERAVEHDGRLGASLSKQVGPLTAAAAVYLVGGALSVACVAIRDPGSLRAMLRLRPAYLAGCGGLFVFYTAPCSGPGAGRRRQSSDRDRSGKLPVARADDRVLASPARPPRRLGARPGTLLALGGAGLALTSGRAFSWNALSTAVRGNPWSFTLALAAAVAWALYSNLARRWTRPHDGGAVRPSSSPPERPCSACDSCCRNAARGPR